MCDKAKNIIFQCASTIRLHKLMINYFSKSLLAFIALSAAQSTAQTRIHSAILVIDTSNNASYNQVHWLVRTPYLSIKASNALITFNDGQLNKVFLIFQQKPFVFDKNLPDGTTIYDGYCIEVLRELAYQFDFT